MQTGSMAFFTYLLTKRGKKMFQTMSVKSIFILAGIVVILTVQSSPVLALEERPLVFISVLVGAARFADDDLNFRQSASNDPTTISVNDLSSMPYGGVVVQYPLGGENTVWGFDGSLLFGVRSSNSRVVASNNQVSIRLDSQLLLTDVAAGLYLSHSSEYWRLYVAAGPAMMFGEYNEDMDQDDLTVTPNLRASSTYTESAFGIGGYVRAGIEYRLNSLDSIGICARALKTNLEFDSAPDPTSNLSGVQGFLSFSRYF